MRINHRFTNKWRFNSRYPLNRGFKKLFLSCFCLFATGLILAQYSYITTASADSLAFGLWATGVDDAGNKRLNDEQDLHWELLRVQRGEGANTITDSSGRTSKPGYVGVLPLSNDSSNKKGTGTCQFSGNRSAGIGTDNPTPAYMVKESGGRAGAGGQWGLISGSSRWIGQNKYAENYNGSDCRDPTMSFPGVTEGACHHNEACYNYANEYVFGLKNGFDVPYNIDPTKYRINLSITMVADNRAKIYLNDTCQLLATGYDEMVGKNVDRTSGWFYTGYTNFREIIFTNPDGVADCIKPGSNKIAIHVQSTPTLTGINISKISLLGYSLDPTITVSRPVAPPGSQVTFTYKGKHVGTTANITPVGYREIVFPPGVKPELSFFQKRYSIPQGCAYYTSTWPKATCVDGGAKNASFTSDDTKSFDLDDGTVTLQNTPGYTVCRVFSIGIRDISNDTTSNRNVDSTPVCVLIASTPYLVSVGGNVWAGGSTTGPAYTGAGNITVGQPAGFGSFGEYGVFATGDISFFGSGGMLGTSGLGMTNGARLTFANVSPRLGSFSTSHRITARVDPGGLSNKNWSQILSDGTNKAFSIPGSGSYDIPATELPLGKHITIYATNRTVRITGNITYATGATSFSGLPSLTIIAKNIEVGEGVREIAGYFYATDSFVTCSSGPRSSTQNGTAIMGQIAIGGPCNSQLYLNGAVTIANNGSNGLILNRSFGGESAGNPAEIFRMRPEVYLTLYEESIKSGTAVITTVHELELPPRY